ncbi:MAG: 30S ribosomal protein S1 [Candidatus Paralactobacillus gallistercoris]|uniref:30S ribosomal protein S1 n=1 Tax=Candidatus Paralactobacillus gallistercoris TaxID=2838724 RepID=A0A948X184_9LACO|nr:30S ribosomal protein S1 [Candidatus Paralactobacillus gallistercoris]
MDNKDSKAMEEALNSVKTVQIGDVVKGDVLAVEDKQLIVGIQNTGAEGVVPLRELTNDPNANINDIAKKGDVLDLVVLSRIMGGDKENGQYVLSKRRLEARQAWSDIQDKYRNDETITVKVTGVVKGGLVVDANGVRGFIPASMVEDHFIKDLAQYKGKELECKIMEIEPSSNRLILSHREIVLAEKEAKKKALVEKLLPGDIVEGKVARLTNFGAFIDLGGIDGLVHVSEIAYEHIDKPSDALKVGQDVKAKVLSVDPDSGRISLSIKATLPQPWDNVAEKAPVGSVLEGKVQRLTEFGAFVEVFPGVEGLVHISQISHKHIATPNDVLQPGQEVKVKVLSVDPAQHRLALSIKALEETPAEEKKANDAKKAAAEQRKQEMQNVKEYKPEDSNGFSIGDMIGNQLKEATHEEDK